LRSCADLGYSRVALNHTADARIVEALTTVQRQHGGYIPQGAFRTLAAELGVPIYRLYGVATFFPHFRVEPPPALDVRVCSDLSCRLRGAPALLGALEGAARARGPAEVAVAAASCLGRCDGAPAFTLNDVPYFGLGEAARRDVVAAVQNGTSLPPPPGPPSLRELRADPYGGGERRYGALRRLLETGDVAGVLDALKGADLRGFGGAGFRTAVKWEAVRNAPGDEKYVICNADESEPATIKDRAILDSAPHLVVEGMAIAGIATGARRGVVYIRHEYEHERESLAQAIVEAKREGLLGDRLLGSERSFHLDVFVSPGGYICGEESALLEAMEGRRAQPRLKPPFPVTHGLFGKPTVINNVETLCMVPVILQRGADWWRAQGVGGSAGIKFVGVSGHVNRPGVFEIPMGTTIAEVIQRAGGVLDGRGLKAVAPSGASSGFLPAHLANVPLDFDALAKAGSMLGSGAICVVAEGTCMVDVALSVARFFARESCGKCWPCRVGSEKIVHMLEAVSWGAGDAETLGPLDELAQTLVLTSICGLGQVVPNAIDSVRRYFKEEVDAHLHQRRCPAGTCVMEPPTRVNGGVVPS